MNGLHAVDAIFRVEQGSEEKRIIARAGASLVAPGSSVLLDDSSAGVWLFRSLDRVDTLTIVTNSGCHETKSFLVSRSGRCSKS